MSMIPHLFTAREVAPLLGIGPHTVRIIARRLHIPGRHVAGTVSFTAEEIEVMRHRPDKRRRGGNADGGTRIETR